MYFPLILEGKKIFFKGIQKINNIFNKILQKKKKIFFFRNKNLNQNIQIKKFI
jgi:hypothetical protein